MGMGYWRIDMRLFKRKADRHDALDAAVSEWRSRKSSEGGRLSGAARDAILRSATTPDASPKPRLVELFTPARRLALTGGLPAIALAVALGIVAQPWNSTRTTLDRTTRPMHASKMNGEVVFVIANGQRAHNVYRSTDPGRFNSDPAFVTRGGLFSDSLHTGPDLVFYRID